LRAVRDRGTDLRAGGVDRGRPRGDRAHAPVPRAPPLARSPGSGARPMKRAGSIERYEAMRRAFRDLTDIDADGAATRARVLAGAVREAARRDRSRRLALPAVAALIVTASVTAALAVVH